MRSDGHVECLFNLINSDVRVSDGLLDIDQSKKTLILNPASEEGRANTSIRGESRDPIFPTAFSLFLSSLYFHVLSTLPINAQFIPPS